MSMLQSFFEIGTDETLFDGLYISKNKALCERYMGQYPVISVSLKSVEALNFDPTPFVEAYKKRRDYVYDRLIKMGLEVNKPEGAFYVFPKISEFGMSSYDFCLNLVKEKSVALIPGDCFLTDDYVRISYCVDNDTIVNAMDLLEEYINELRRK